jgi:hypothetical protein
LKLFASLPLLEQVNEVIACRKALGLTELDVMVVVTGFVVGEV